MTAPISVKVLKQDFSLIEVSGVRYKQTELTIEERDRDACCWCCARLSERLCEHLAPFCYQGWVFDRI